MFHSVWWYFPLFDFLYILWHSSLINLALKQRLTTTRKWPTVSIEKNVFKNVLMTRFSRHLLSSDASSLDSSRSPSPCFETMTSNKLGRSWCQELNHLLGRRAPQRTGIYDQMEHFFTNRKFHFCSHRNFRFFVLNRKRPTSYVLCPGLCTDKI